MAISYSKQQRQIAKEHGLELVTIAFGKVSLQAPVTSREADLVRDCFRKIMAGRKKAIDALAKGGA